MTNGIKVKKRNGSIEHLNLEKMHKMVDEACKDLAGVSASQVEMQSGIQFYDGITTAEIQEILIRSASDLISLENPNYQFVADFFSSLFVKVSSEKFTRHQNFKITLKNVLMLESMMKRFFGTIRRMKSQLRSDLLIMNVIICLLTLVFVRL